jgi:hypothetical protein
VPLLHPTTGWGEGIAPAAAVDTPDVSQMSSAKLNYQLAGNFLDLSNAESVGYSQ